MPVLTIYVWIPIEDNVGHTSMLLPDGTYISWWPNGSCSAKNPSRPAEPHTAFQQDVDAEGDGNPHTCKIECSDDQIEKIKTWWREYKSSKENKYHLLKSNCSTVVYIALKVAFPELECFNNDVKLWVPGAIALIAGYLSAGERNICNKVSDVADAAEKEALQIADNFGVSGKKIKKARKVIKKKS